MALEQQLNLTPTQNSVDGERTNGVDTNIRDGGDDGNKAPRLPRWTRQEILVLIQGKRVAENRVRRGRASGMGIGSGQIEPKWASVSSYCKRHGVNRGPVQCRKRWSNLAGDFKKIKEWETSIREETESFWVMRNDLRRERKLPGFFDREVYDILDGGVGTVPGLALALAPSSTAAEAEAVVEEVVFDSGRSAAAEDGLFSDFEQEEGGGSPEAVVKEVQPIKVAVTAGVANPTPISEKQYQPAPRASQAQVCRSEKTGGSGIFQLLLVLKLHHRLVLHAEKLYCFLCTLQFHQMIKGPPQILRWGLLRMRNGNGNGLRWMVMRKPSVCRVI
ncbi:PREDICTED: trihelix transcription factor GT-2 isoform X2 [Populus euphratica]|uniref:Trihelix transcription factor GT-2 isoform X2 n=1 Tax=Populus euphratica TaxID=75702 RepID=A0AAJ6UU22_POPEU|nr:PREDICTED: trihelix transcription factor GT-2 isoform X2 [Populus euphratica]